MMVFRVKKDKDNPYVIINKLMVQDPNLSAKAKGILLYLLSRPDDWKVYQNEITKNFTDGRDSIRSGIRELEKRGYIRRIQARNELGYFVDTEYEVHEYPINSISPSVDGKSVAGEPDATNKEVTKKGKNRVKGMKPRSLLDISADLDNTGTQRRAQADQVRFGKVLKIGNNP